MYDFKLDNYESDKLNKWLGEHKKVCSITYAGAIGGKLTYTFTPTSLGCVVKIICACAAEVDVTEYDAW